MTLGAKRFPEDDQGNLIKGAERHPILEDDVVIYAGATVNNKAIASYLVSLYCSLAVLTDDALAVLDGVEIGKYLEYK